MRIHQPKSYARKALGSLAIVPAPLTVRVGESIIATAMDGSQPVQDVEWSCADESIELEPDEMGKLKITGKAEGECTITAKATANGATGDARVTVTPAKAEGDVQKLSLDARVARLEGERVTLSAEELRVCRKSGLDPEEMLATKRRELAAKASAAVLSDGITPELERVLRKSGITIEQYRASEAKRAARARA